MKQKTCDLAPYYFHQGTSSFAYEYLGCHLSRVGDRYEYVFRVWAPNARDVSIASDVFGWDTPRPMTRLSENGVYEYRESFDRSLDGTLYKYRITGFDGSVHLKGDPYAFRSFGGADGASVITDPTTFVFGDDAWMKHRKKAVFGIKGRKYSYLSTPVNIYEVHAASFLRHKDGSYLSYRELADTLIPYVKHMGYTHVELMPIAEYPFDGSWGYQVCAFYAPTGRFGSPDDFRYFVDLAHRSGIGVLLDWVPAHFPKDEWGLYEFDGKPLYEYQGKDRMESEGWGTRFFDLARPEVKSFLISNAAYFLREFHVDGLRVDAVAAMLYLDFDRRPGEWVPNYKGGKENLEAIAFLSQLNATLLSEFPDVLMIAEESTSFPGVTSPTSTGGLGFSLKWNMGFANDFYAYLSRDPVYRKYHHTALNFPLMYAYTSNFVLPISHDEVVHGKRSFIDKMFGSYEDKFSEARTALMLMMTYPGKKMLFMGTEFAQFREWDFASSLEWFMLDYPMHRMFRDYVAGLNRFYLDHDELWANDFDPAGFTWILPDESEKNLVAFKRNGRAGRSLTVVISFSGASETVTLPIKRGQTYRLLFATDPGISIPENGKKNTDKSFTVSLPPFSGVILREEPMKRTITISENPEIDCM